MTQNVFQPTRFVGFWMVVVIVLYLQFLVFRAVSNPNDFAAYFYGVPQPESQDAFVLVYAIRTFFLSVFALVLLLRKQFVALTLYAGVAALMPLGDAFLVAYQSGHLPTVTRHFLVTAFLLLTSFFMTRLAKQARKTN